MSPPTDRPLEIALDVELGRATGAKQALAELLDLDLGQSEFYAVSEPRLSSDAPYGVALTIHFYPRDPFEPDTITDALTQVLDRFKTSLPRVAASATALQITCK